jgi:hypothetical protein
MTMIKPCDAAARVFRGSGEQFRLAPNQSSSLLPWFLDFYPVMAPIIGANHLRASKAFLAKLNNIGARLTL